MSEELKMIDSYKSIFNMCPTSPFGSVPLHLVLLEKFRLPHLRKMLNKLDKNIRSQVQLTLDNPNRQA